jgi:hypothetical protein
MKFWALFWCHSYLLCSFGRLVFAATKADGAKVSAHVSANSVPTTIVRRQAALALEVPPVQATACTEYALRTDAAPSGGGYLWEYYHFLIDFAPAMYHHIHNDNSSCKILYAPGWNSEARDHLSLAVESHEGVPRSMQDKFDFFLGKPLGLRIEFTPNEGVHYGTSRTRVDWNCHSTTEQWSNQSAEFFTEFRDFARGLGGIAPVKRDVLVVERGQVIAGSGYDRRHLEDAFYDSLVHDSAANGLNTAVVTLETKTAAEQIALFADVRVIIAQHGAALSNMIFAQKDALVIEIGYVVKNNGNTITSGPKSHIYETLAKKLGLHYLHYWTTEYSEDYIHAAADYVHGAQRNSLLAQEAYGARSPLQAQEAIALQDILAVIRQFVRGGSSEIVCPKGMACAGTNFARKRE